MLAFAYDAPRLIAKLDSRLESALRQMDGVTHTELLSITLTLPELASLHLTKLSSGSIYWACSHDQNFRLAIGREITLEAEGENRFLELQQRFSALSQNWVRLSPDGYSAKVQAFLGFAFSPSEAMQDCWKGFANACIHIPSILLERKGSISSLTFTCDMRSGEKALDRIKKQWLKLAGDLFLSVTSFAPPLKAFPSLQRISDIPSKEQWLTQVRGVLDIIDQGLLEKVVLTRRVRFFGERPLQAARSLAWLASRHAGGIQFAYAAPDATLIGATPERLVSLGGDKVICDAVAGTVCRDLRTEFDRQLGSSLLTDNKARHEQRLVVDKILNSLEPWCVSLNAPVEPQLLKSFAVQHLWSAIHGRVKQGVSLFDLISSLHPTPAVGGTPCHQALAWLKAHEKDQRGWYTGALGWISCDGSGELAVILRCALLRNNVADLFAGAGIVSNSHPQSELDETEWKLRTMLDFLAVA